MVLLCTALIGAVVLHGTRSARLHVVTAAAAPARDATGQPPVPVAVSTVSRADVPVRLSALGSVVPSIR